MPARWLIVSPSTGTMHSLKPRATRCEAGSFTPPDGAPFPSRPPLISTSPFIHLQSCGPPPLRRGAEPRRQSAFFKKPVSPNTFLGVNLFLTPRGSTQSHDFGDLMTKTDRITRHVVILASLLLALLLPIASSYGKQKKGADVPPFLYEAGTEKVEKGCGGKLEVLKEGFSFKCPGGTINLPYSAITFSDCAGCPRP